MKDKNRDVNFLISKIVISLIAINLIFISCGKQSTPELTVVKTFPLEVELQAEVVSIPEMAMNPLNMFIVGDKLVIFRPANDVVFQFYRLYDLSYLYGYGTIGHAGNEFSFIDNSITQLDSNRFRVFFQLKNMIAEICLTDSFVELDRKSIIKSPFNDVVNGFCFINDSISVCFSDFRKTTEYDLCNIYTKEKKSFSPYPEWVLPAPKIDPMLVYMKSSVAKPDGSRFASFYAFFPRFRIYDTETHLLKDILLDTSMAEKSFTEDVRKRRIYFRTSEAYGDFIYSLGSVYPNKDEKQSVLQVWSWTGEPIAQYILDRELSCFTISRKTGKLYAAGLNEEKELYVHNDILIK